MIITKSIIIVISIIITIFYYYYHLRYYYYYSYLNSVVIIINANNDAKQQQNIRKTRTKLNYLLFKFSFFSLSLITSRIPMDCPHFPPIDHEFGRITVIKRKPHAHGDEARNKRGSASARNGEGDEPACIFHSSETAGINNTRFVSSQKRSITMHLFLLQIKTILVLLFFYLFLFLNFLFSFLSISLSVFFFFFTKGSGTFHLLNSPPLNSLLHP